MKTLYIHAGHSKTGSTSIQTFLFWNREMLLEKHNLYVPLTGKRPTTDSIRHDTSAGFFEKEKFVALKSELEAHPDADYLITDEILFLNAALNESVIAKLRHFFPDHQIKIVLYVRKFDEFIKSYFNERQKILQPEAVYHDYPSYIRYLFKSEFLHVSKRIACFSRLVGRENLILRIYDKKFLKNNNVVEDFFSALNLCVHSEADTAIQANPRLNDSILPLLNAAQKNLPPNPVSEGLYKKIRDVAQKASTLSADHSREIAGYFPALEKEIGNIARYLPEYASLYEHEPPDLSMRPSDARGTDIFLASLDYQAQYQLELLTHYVSMISNTLGKVVDNLDALSRKIDALSNNLKGD